MADFTDNSSETRSGLNGEESEQAAEDYIFSPSDHEGWLSYLETNGYCVLRSVIDSANVDSIVSMIWNDMKKLFNADREDPSTWGSIPNGVAGILSKGIPQTEGPWRVRGDEAVREAFRHIWGTDDLLVSMDSLLCWLPWWQNDMWRPCSEGLHLDQNPFVKPDRVCVQGMVPLLDVTHASGGLEVVPFSHTPDAQDLFRRNHPHFNSKHGTDWCPMSKAWPELPPPILLMARAGDLILWDSRTIHGGRVGDGHSAPPDTIELARLAATVCMTPKELASDGVKAARRNGYKKGVTFTHWPHEAHLTGLHPSGYVPVPLSERVKELI